MNNVLDHTPQSAAAAPDGHTTASTLADLAHQLMNARLAEEAAKRRRIAIEDQIIELADVREEGAATLQLDNGFTPPGS
jgi:hypothetical protein